MLIFADVIFQRPYLKIRGWLSRMITLANMTINGIVLLLVLWSYKTKDYKTIHWALNLSTLR